MKASPIISNHEADNRLLWRGTSLCLAITQIQTCLRQANYFNRNLSRTTLTIHLRNSMNGINNRLK